VSNESEYILKLKWKYQKIRCGFYSKNLYTLVLCSVFHIFLFRCECVNFTA
jgi:hypothetical protein